MHRLIASALALVALAACYEPIKNFDAGPHVHPTEDAGEPDSGRVYFADGAACAADGQCASGKCAIGCAGTGTCAKVGCQQDSDCAVSGSSVTYCCGAGGVCAPIAGSTCGTRAGKLGASCASGKASDCFQGYACLEGCTLGGYCSKPCSTETDCTSERTDFTCASVSAGGQRYCVPHPDRYGACAKAAECSLPLSCQPVMSFDQTTVITKCELAEGEGPVGSSCAQDSECAAGYCWSGDGYRGVCGGVCSGSDVDCGCAGADGGCREQICEPYTFFSQGQVLGSARLCVDAMRCGDDTDCGRPVPVWPDAGADAGEQDAGMLDGGLPRHCQVRPTELGWSVTCILDKYPSAKADGVGCQQSSECASTRCKGGVCTARQMAGTACSAPVDCLSNLCLASTCVQLCNDGTVCPPGTSCSLQTVAFGSGIAGSGQLEICR